MQSNAAGLRDPFRGGEEPWGDSCPWSSLGSTQAVTTAATNGIVTVDLDLPPLLASPSN